MGSLYYIQTCLRHGLAACPDGLVLRLRTDTFIASGLVERVLQAMNGPQPKPAVRLFSAPIWTPWIDYEEPFHVADELLIGLNRDLARLARFDIGPLVEFGYPLANTHTLAYMPDRADYGHIYFDFLAAQRDASIFFNDPTTAKFAKLAIATACPAYLAMLGLWYRTIRDNFLCFSEPEELEFRPGGKTPARYYVDRRPLPAAPDHLFDQASAGFFNHFYIFDMAAFVEKIEHLDRARFGPLVDAMKDPAPLLTEVPGQHRKSFACMMRTIAQTVPPGVLPEPDLPTRLRRTMRRGLRRALRMVG
jgi:hypothetical protein